MSRNLSQRRQKAGAFVLCRGWQPCIALPVDCNVQMFLHCAWICSACTVRHFAASCHKKTKRCGKPRISHALNTSLPASSGIRRSKVCTASCATSCRPLTLILLSTAAASADASTYAKLRQQSLHYLTPACVSARLDFAVLRRLHKMVHAQSTCANRAGFTVPDSITRAAKDLETQGWAVVPDVLTAAECTEYVDGAWSWLSNLNTGVSRNDPDTWGDDRWPSSFRGIINTLEVSHQDFVWRVRQNPKVLQVFEALWGTNELLSSFDSINILKPGQHESSTDGWLHVDQAPLRKGVACIQGLINMVDVSPETGTLLVKHGSHLSHEDFFENATVLSQQQKQQTEDFYKFQDTERDYFRRFPSKPLSAKAGSLFLWDSRLAHQNLLPDNTDKWRHVVYTCYQPRSLATDKDLALKQQAYNDRRVTTHWPAMNVKLFPKEGNSYYGAAGAKRPNFKVVPTRERVETDMTKQLAGIKPYPKESIRRQTPLIHLAV